MFPQCLILLFGDILTAQNLLIISRLLLRNLIILEPHTLLRAERTVRVWLCVRAPNKYVQFLAAAAAARVFPPLRKVSDIFSDFAFQVAPMVVALQ